MLQRDKVVSIVESTLLAQSDLTVVGFTSKCTSDSFSLICQTSKFVLTISETKNQSKTSPEYIFVICNNNFLFSAKILRYKDIKNLLDIISIICKKGVVYAVRISEYKNTVGKLYNLRIDNKLYDFYVETLGDLIDLGLMYIVYKK